MTYNPERHHRRSLRLKNYDYSQAGAYFITICTNNRDCVFGDVVNGEMWLNKCGTIVENEWIKTTKLRTNVMLDKHIIMPNHIHGIIIITDDGRGTLQRAPTVEQFGKPVSNSIPTIIRLFKSATTKQINQIRHTPTIPVWQRNYYEHIIRDEDNLNQIREYIINNPVKWELDSNHPKNIKW